MHWTIQKLKFLASLRTSSVDKKSHDDEMPVRLCNYTDVYYNEHITSAIAFMDATATTDEIERFSLRRGDVLITKDSEDPNDIAVPACVVDDLEGVLCGYHLAQVRPHPSTAHGPYLARAFATSGISDQFNCRATGITRHGLSKDTIGSSLFFVPPLEEQQAIAGFLDRETARIDELVAKKQRFIELLAEKRTALISHAVTKGLNPDAPTKDSVIEWLGRVPEHWDVFALRRRWQVIDCKHRTVPFLDEGIPLASIGEVQNIELDLSNAKRTSYDEYRLLVENDRQPRRGDIIYSRNATVGAAAYVNTDEMFCMGQDVCMIRSRKQNQRYLAFQLRSPSVMSQLDQIMVGATFKRVNVADIKALTVACPPIAEQQAIGTYCREGSAQFQGLMDAVQSGICRLGEYRSALISAAVTGKIDVR